MHIAPNTLRSPGTSYQNMLYQNSMPESLSITFAPEIIEGHILWKFKEVTYSFQMLPSIGISKRDTRMDLKRGRIPGLNRHLQ